MKKKNVGLLVDDKNIGNKNLTLAQKKITV